MEGPLSEPCLHSEGKITLVGESHASPDLLREEGPVSGGRKKNWSKLGLLGDYNCMDQIENIRVKIREKGEITFK